MKSNYSVGYRKPPKNSQFKKGKSGNPKGRRKGTRNFQTDLLKELHELVVVRERDGARKLTKQQIIAKQLIAKCAQGDSQALGRLLPVLAQIEQIASEAREETPEPELSPEILQRWAKRYMAKSAKSAK